MASKAKSGLTAVRQYPEKILEPPNVYTVGATVFSSQIRDGQGHSSLHVGVSNNTTFTLKILHSWRPTGPFTLDQSISSIVDSETGLHSADVLVPVTKRYVRITVDAPAPGLGTSFEIGAYFLPRTPVSSVLVSGFGGLSVISSKGLPWSKITTHADISILPGGTVSLPVPPADTVRMTVQNTGPASSLIRIRESGGPAASGFILPRFSSKEYGGIGGSISQLVAEDIAGIPTTVMVQFERI